VPVSFSVLVPVYQAAATIGDALASVRGQTYAAHEILVCDDGSTDDLDSALAPHRDAITLVRQPNRGASAARNAVLRRATGDFVVTLDADDLYLPTRLGRLAELAAAQPELDLLATDANFITGGQVNGRFHDRTEFPAEGQREAILDRCFLISPAMRRSSLLAIGGYDESLRTAEDWDCFIRLILAGARAGLVDEPLLEYRLGDASLTAKRGETLQDRVRVLEKAAKQPGLSDAEQRMLRGSLGRHRGRALQQAARDAVAAGDRDARARLLAVAHSRDVGLRARVGAAAAALLPRSARRLVDATLSESAGRP
jgi:glycosyltransferase involved in cell wall biosynthesis